MSVVHDLDDALCEYSCCSGDVAKCPDYAASKCGGEFGRVSLYNMMAAPVTIGLPAFLTDKDFDPTVHRDSFQFVHRMVGNINIDI